MLAVPAYKIIEGSVEWAEKYAEFCRQAYIHAYPRPELGITEDLFSRGVFTSPRIIKYFRDKCIRTETRRTWLAVGENQQILGVVAAQLYPGRCDMNSFYVKPDQKGKGIGHALYQEVLNFAEGRKIQVDVIGYMKETIDMYKHWGFHIDDTRQAFSYELIEWPEEARQNYKAIYMVKPSNTLEK